MRGWWWRLPVVLIVLAADVLLLRVSGTVGRGAGWLLGASALAVPVGLALLLTRRWDARRVVAAIAVVVAATSLVWLRTETPAMPDRLAARVDALEPLTDHTPVATTRGGNALCFDACPVVIRDYDVPDPAATMARVGEALRTHGYDVEVRDRGDGERQLVATDGPIAVEVHVVLPGPGPDGPWPGNLHVTAESAYPSS